MREQILAYLPCERSTHHLSHGRHFWATVLALGYFLNQFWFLLLTFVGLNLFQTAFTGFCPLKRILLKALKGSGAKCCSDAVDISS
jgi:hypothetical protein